VPKIRERLLAHGLDVPLVGDFHFNGHKLLADNPACAEALAKLRINPGNVGAAPSATTSSRDDRTGLPVRQAGAHRRQLGQPRPGLLARMMDENARRAAAQGCDAVMREAMVASALESAAQGRGTRPAGDRIVLSCKVSACRT
jgi:(E)-4-hydroxy-3-methylbut-2-enyl-diphosphate synthase